MLFVDFTLARALRVFTYVSASYFLIWAALWLLETFLCKASDREPPVIKSRVPFLGHALRLWSRGISYYQVLREQSDLPIVTVFFGTQKCYVVNSPDLITQINRQGKRVDRTLPLMTVSAGKIFGIHGDDFVQLTSGTTLKGSLRSDLQVMEHSSLEAGTESLKEIHENLTAQVSDVLNGLATQDPVNLDLQDWLQKTLTKSTARTFLGPGNPLDQSAELVDSLWIMESSLKALTMLPYPSVTARKAVSARERLVQAVMKDIGSERTRSRLTCGMEQRLWEISERHKTSTEFLARYELGLFTGFVINTVPAAFWLLGHLSTDKKLASRVRDEVNISVKTIGPAGLTLDVNVLRAQCPLLVSTCREVLRHISSATSTYWVQEDIHLSEGFVLDKGAIIQIPAAAIHSNPAIWGESAAEFDPERFLKREKIHPSANRTFGGSVCPGRHLALDQLLTFTAIFIHTFEIELLPETPRLPAQEVTNVLSVKKPESDLRVRIARRASICGKKWMFCQEIGLGMETALVQKASDI
ncbi:cytochrome P450 [Colletotrichum zoysiae]|uniref:Cytochrome P450 n=1 Tax=Colletotrichum zoysiae TaxID=1216348 RepID=A0AAD9M4X1_9PEZI|nr:cytochrome P450 [Colletotrichum zoysiae]